MPPSEPITVIPMLSVGDVGPSSIAAMKSMMACSSAASVKHASELLASSSKLNAELSSQPGISIISFTSSFALSIQPARVKKRAITIANFLFMSRLRE